MRYLPGGAAPMNRVDTVLGKGFVFPESLPEIYTLESKKSRDLGQPVSLSFDRTKQADECEARL